MHFQLVKYNIKWKNININDSQNWFIFIFLCYVWITHLVNKCNILFGIGLLKMVSDFGSVQYFINYINAFRTSVKIFVPTCDWNDSVW